MISIKHKLISCSELAGAVIIAQSVDFTRIQLVAALDTVTVAIQGVIVELVFLSLLAGVFENAREIARIPTGKPAASVMRAVAGGGCTEVAPDGGGESPGGILRAVFKKCRGGSCRREREWEQEKKRYRGQTKKKL